MNDNQELHNLLRSIQTELVALKKTTLDIESRLLNIERSTQNMDTHIGFIESIYDTLKYPICNVLDYYYGKQIATDHLLQIKRDVTEDDARQDIKSQDIKSQDIKSQDIKSQDIKSQDIKSQDDDVE